MQFTNSFLPQVTNTLLRQEISNLHNEVKGYGDYDGLPNASILVGSPRGLQYCMDRLQLHTQNIFNVLTSSAYTPSAFELSALLNYLDSFVTFFFDINYYAARGNDLISCTERFNNLSNSTIQSLSANLLNALPEYIISGLGPTFFNAISNNALANLTFKFFPLMNGTTVNGLSANFFNNLNPSTIVHGLNYPFLSNITNPAVIRGLSSTFVQAIVADVLGQFPSSFFNALNTTVVGQLTLANVAAVPTATWSGLNVDFYNALALEVVANKIVYGTLNQLSNANIAALNVSFLNAINASTVDAMIKNNGSSVRAGGSVPSQIPKNKWLLLDGAKYSALLASATVADIPALTNIDTSLLRVDALNALPPSVIGGLPNTFINALRADQINNLSGYAVSGLVSSQINLFTATQIAGFSSNVIGLSVNAIFGLSAEACNKLVNCLDNLDQATASYLTTGLILGLPSGTISQLSTATCNKLMTCINNFSAQKIRGLIPYFFDALTSPMVGRLTATFMNSLPDYLINKLSRSFLNNLANGWNGTYIPSDAGRALIQNLSPAFLESVLTNSSSTSLGSSAAFLNALSAAQVAGGVVNGREYVALSATKLNAIVQATDGILTIPNLSVTFFENLASTAQGRVVIANLSGLFFTVISSDQITDSLNLNFFESLVTGTATTLKPVSDFLQRLTATFFNAWSVNKPTFIPNLSVTLLNAIFNSNTNLNFAINLSTLSATAFGQLNGAVLQGLSIGKLRTLTQAQLAALTAPQIQAMTNANFFNNLTVPQITDYISNNAQNTFWPLSQMTASVVSNLTATFFTNLNSATDQMFCLNASFINNINIDILRTIRTKGIATNIINEVSTERRAIIYTLDYYKLLSNERIASLDERHEEQLGNLSPSDFIGYNNFFKQLSNTNLINLLSAKPTWANVFPKVSSIKISGGNAANSIRSFNAGSVVTFTVAMTDKITFSATNISLSLSNGSTATYVSGNGAMSFVFQYTVAAGQNVSDLTVTGLNFNGATATAYTGRTINFAGVTAHPTDTVELDTSIPQINSLLLSNDTGVSTTDFITNNGTQIITGTLSNGLSTGDVVEISLNNGTTWVAVTATANTFTYATTLSGKSNLIARVRDRAGNTSSKSQKYTIDNVASTVQITSLSLSKDTGISATDFITNSTALQTITGILSSASNPDDIVEISIDNGNSWAVATNTSKTTFSYTTRLPSNTTIIARVSDKAGNIGNRRSQDYRLDTTAPTAQINSLLLSDDTGISATDFITNKTEQTITISLNSALGVDDIVQVSVDNGNTWNNATVMNDGFTYTITTTLSSNNKMIARVIDKAGNIGNKRSQEYIIDTTAPNGPSVWAPNTIAGENSNVVIGITDSNAVVNDLLEIVTVDSANNITVIGRYTLTNADILSGRVLITLPYVSSTGLKARITDQFGNVSTMSGAAINLTGLSSTWFNSLSSYAASTLTAGFLNAMPSESGLLMSVNSQFFNDINTHAFASISSDLLKYIGKRIHDEQAITSTSAIKVVLSAEKIEVIPKDKIKDLLNEWMSEPTIVNFIPASILNSMTLDQVKSMDSNFSQHIANSYFSSGHATPNIIIGLAINSTTSNLAISNAQLSSLSDDAINLFLGIYLNKTTTTVAAPINVLNALTAHQASVLDAGMFQSAMPISDIRSGLLSATFVNNISAKAFGSLSIDALSALSVAINNNPTKYKFNESQLQALDASGLAAILSSYKGVDQTYTGYIPHNILNNLSNVQIKNIASGVINHCITDLMNADLNINVLISLGNAVCAYSRIVPNNVLSVMLATSVFQQLTGDRLIAFLKAWDIPAGGNYANIPPAILTILTTAQIATLPIGLLKNSVDSSVLTAAQLNALSPSVINQLGVEWLNVLSNGVVSQLSGIFLSAIPTDVFKLLSSDFIGHINSSLVTSISPSTIRAIAGQYIGKHTAFTTNQVANFSADQLRELFFGSASNDSGDYQFADLSNVLHDINLSDGQPVPDELANIPLYILLGTITDEAERERLTAHIGNLNTLISGAENAYANGNALVKLDSIYAIRSLLFRATTDKLMLLSLDTINKLTTLNNATYNWESTGRLIEESSILVPESATSIKNLLLEKFSMFGKSIVANANDAIIAAVGQKLKADLASGIISTVISDAQFRALPNHQLSVLLSQWAQDHAAIPQQLLEKFSVRQIAGLTPDNFAMIVGTADAAHIPDSFLVGLGLIAKELDDNKEAAQLAGWLTLAVTPTPAFEARLSAAQLQSLTPAKLKLFLSPWTDSYIAAPVSAYILEMLNDTQLASLDDAVYKSLTATEIQAILSRISVNKIGLLSPEAFIYDVDNLEGKAWPSDVQLAVMSIDQVNALFSMWRNKALGKIAVDGGELVNSPDELFRKTIMTLSASVRENILVGGELGSHVAALSFDENNLSVIHTLPLGLLSFLNNDAIDLIAEKDELAPNMHDTMFFSKVEFSMLTDAQVTRYINTYLGNRGDSSSLPLDLLANLSYKQVKVLIDDQFGAISVDVIPLLSDEFMMGVTESQLNTWIASDKIKAISLDSMPFIDVNVIANFGTRLNNFTADQLANLRPDQIRAIGSIIASSEADGLRRPYLHSVDLESFIDANLVPDQYAFLNETMFEHLTETQRQQISPVLMPYIATDIIAQLSIDGELNQLTDEQIWNLTNDQIKAAFPYGATRSALRSSTQLGLSIDQVLDSSLGNVDVATLDLAGLSSLDIARLPLETVAHFSRAELAHLTSDQIFNLTLDQIRAIGQTNYSALAQPGPALGFNAAQISTLSAQQINNLTAATIGDFSATQFKALIGTAYFNTIDSAKLRFVSAAVLNALSSSELAILSADQRVVLGLNISNDQVGDERGIARYLHSVNPTTAYSLLDLPDAPTRAPANLINPATNNSNYTWSMTAINGFHVDSFVYTSAADFIKTYITPYRDVTTMRYILLDNLYSSSRYDITNSAGNIVSRFDGANLNNKKIMLARKHLQLLRIFASAGLISGADAMFDSASNLHGVQSDRENVADYLTGIGWVASALQAPWGAFYSTFISKGYGGGRGGRVFDGNFLRNSWTAARDYFGYPKNKKNTIVPVTPTSAGQTLSNDATGAGAGSSDDIISSEQITRDALGKIAELEAERADLPHDIDDRLSTLEKERDVILKKHARVTTKLNALKNAVGSFGENTEDDLRAEVIELNRQKREKDAAIKSLKPTQQRVRAIEMEIIRLRDTTNIQRDAINPAAVISEAVATRPAAVPNIVSFADAATRINAERIRFNNLSFREKLRLLKLNPTKKLQGFAKGGWIFAVANLMGAINGIDGIYNGIRDLDTPGMSDSDAAMRIFTGTLSTLGGASLLIGDMIDTINYVNDLDVDMAALAKSGATPTELSATITKMNADAAQKFLGTRFTNVALSLFYLSQAVGIVYKEWALYDRAKGGNQFESAMIATFSVVVRLVILGVDWATRMSLGWNLVAGLAMMVIPPLFDNLLNYFTSDSKDYLNHVKDDLISQGRLIEANYWVSARQRIDDHANLFQQYNIVTYQQMQLNDLLNTMLADHADKLKLVLVQQRKAAMRAAENFTFLSNSVGAMISSLANTNSAKISDFYLIQIETSGKGAYYIRQPGADDSKFSYAIQNHLSVNPLTAGAAQSLRNQVDFTTSNMEKYFSVDAFVGSDVDADKGGIIILRGTKANQYDVNVALIQLTSSDDYFTTAGKNFIIDASGADKNMVFQLASHTKVLAGSGVNTFDVDQDRVTDGSYQIIATDIDKNELNLMGGAARSIDLDLDSFLGVRVVQHTVNYNLGNRATGSQVGQYYVANFGGKNTINMSGGASSVIVNGLGNTVNLSNNNNTVYAQLLSNVNVLQTSDYQSMSVGNYDAEVDQSKVATASNNKLVFSNDRLVGNEKFVIDIDSSGGHAKIENKGVVVDAANFAHFQQIEGPVSGSTINITGDTGLSALILNDASASGSFNTLNLQDVSGLGIVSSGANIININESNPENNTTLGHTNYIYTQGGASQGTYYSVINANENTIIGASLASARDIINFSQGARFNVLEVGSGEHIINFAKHNGSQIDSGVSGLIRMADGSSGDTTINDEATRDVIEDSIAIELAEDSQASDYLIAYSYDASSGKNEVYIESSTQKLKYTTVNTDIINLSYAELVLKDALNIYYDIDINIIIEAIAELTITQAQSAVNLTGYTGHTGYTLDAVLSRVNLLTANLQNNRIVGTFGNDVLAGTAGVADVLIGGYGNDTYTVDNIGDVVVEYADQGIDSVQASVNYTLTDNVENLTLTGAANINAVGNSGDNILAGNAGSNTLAGGAGNDILIGTSGNDVDTLAGGLGDDTYVVNLLAKNVVVEGVHEGIDTIQTTLTSFSLLNGNHQYDNIENLVYTGATTFSGTGNSLDNTFSVSALSSTVRRTFDGGNGSDTMDYGNAMTALNVTLNSTNGSATMAVNDVLISIENVIGGAGNDTLTGDGSDNILIGAAGNDSIVGGAGNDTLEGGAGDNTLRGGVGIDTVDYSRSTNDINVSLALARAQVTIGASTDILFDIENILGGIYNDTFVGDANGNILNGAGGSDKLMGAAGNDTLLGGSDNDTLAGGDGDDSLVGGVGNDVADYSDATQGVYVSLAIVGTQNTLGAGNDVLDSIESLLGSNFSDSLLGGTGNDTLNGGLGNDSLVGGTGSDVYIVDNLLDVVVEDSVANSGIDTIMTSALASLSLVSYQNVENLIYTGTNNFFGAGNSLNNVLLGNIGNDSLNGGTVGGTDFDTLVGGNGDDTYIISSTSDVVIEAANEGVDTVRTSLDNFSFATMDNVENIIFTGASSAKLVGNTLNNTFFANASGDDTYNGGFGSDTVNYRNSTAVMSINLATGSATGAGVDTLIGIENIIGGSGHDFITGNDADNILDGGSGNNSLVGGAGNDILESGIGNNNLNGGAGSDTVSYRHSSVVVNVSLATKTGNDTIEDVENLIGSDWSDTLIGNNQDNILDGGIAADILTGGLGNDTYIIDNVLDQINEDSVTGSGIDTVKVTLLTYTLGNNLENLIYMGTATFTGYGNGLSNTLSGSSGSDTLSGLDGNDSLMGYADNDSLLGGIGNDTLDGGLGNDTLVGGDGNDVYIVDSTGDVVVEATTASSGTDLVKTKLSSLTLAQNVENLTYTGVGTFSGKGNQLANIIMGGVHADTLDGGAGADTLIGGLGDDTYVIDTTADVIVEATSEGIDTIVSNILLTLNLSTYANVENINYTGTSAFSGTGNSVDNIFWGGIGNDTFDGAAGSDAMSYSKANKSVTVALGLAGTNGSGTGVDVGTDTLINIENIIGGSGRDTITGNDVNNALSAGAGSDTVSGGAGNDTLDGGAGEDSLVGGVGDDVYIIDSANDILVEDSAANGGVDTIASSSLYTVDLRNYSNIENLRFTGVGDFLGIGDAANNVLSSGAGDDTLGGASGADTLIGGNGNDTYYIDSTGDAVIESSTSGAGQDLVITNLSALTLFANVENLTYSGTDSFNVTGNSSNNILQSSVGNDTLNGGTGSDTLGGGDGNDFYIIDDINDVVLENVGSGIDTIITSMANISLIGYLNVENIIYTGTVSAYLSGNTLDNIFQGSSATTLNDTYDGGNGNDTIDYSNATAAMIINLMTGVATGVGADKIVNIENIIGGSANDNITGNEIANLLIGGLGDDTLTGGLGDDTLIGGDGNDVYVIESTGDVVLEESTAGSGIDLIKTTLTSFTLLGDLENLTYTGTNNFTGIGNLLDNIITGNSGNDTLSGDLGDDTLIGGNGSDVYIINSTNDVVLEASTAGSGIDVVQTSLTSLTLFNNVENLRYSGTNDFIGTGNILNNVITGNVGNDTLSGSLGSDTLIGGDGNDVYVVDATTDVVVEESAVGSGIDAVQTTLTGLTLFANVENLTYTGTNNFTGTGNILNNVITGNVGNDTLSGAIGDDTLIGGDGNDLYVIENTGDVVIEESTAGSGIDLIKTTLTSLTLFGNLENLTYTGTNNFAGTGNLLDNMITGNRGNDTLSGSLGNDTLSGNLGNDTLQGGLGNDTYNFARGDGIDVITEDDTTVGNVDTLSFTSSITKNQLWFMQVNNDLEVSVIGTMDKVTLANWYLGDQYKVETIKDSNNKTLTSSAVANLVNAMAQITPPVAGVTTLPSGTTYAAVITAIGTTWN